MVGNRRDHLPSYRSRVVHDQRVSGAENGPIHRREQGVPSAVSRAHGDIVELGAVRLDDDPVLDDEIDSTHPGESHLGSNAESQVTRQDTNDRLQSRLGSRVEPRKVRA